MLSPPHLRVSLALAFVLALAGAGHAVGALWTTRAPCTAAAACCLEVYRSRERCAPLLEREPEACTMVRQRIVEVAGRHVPVLCR